MTISIFELEYLLVILYDTLFNNKDQLWMFNLWNIVYDYDIDDQIVDNGHRDLLQGIPIIVSGEFREFGFVLTHKNCKIIFKYRMCTNRYCNVVKPSWHFFEIWPLQLVKFSIFWIFFIIVL